MYFYLSILPSSKHKIIVLLKHRYAEFISIKVPTMSKPNQKIRKTRYHAFEKLTQPVAQALVAVRKKKLLLIVKPQHCRILISGKRRHKIKVVNIFTFHLLVNSDRMIILPSPVYVRLPSQKYFTVSLFCFENTKLLKQISNNYLFFFYCKKVTNQPHH